MTPMDEAETASLEHWIYGASPERGYGTKAESSGLNGPLYMRYLENHFTPVRVEKTASGSTVIDARMIHPAPANDEVLLSILGRGVADEVQSTDDREPYDRVARRRPADRPDHLRRCGGGGGRLRPAPPQGERQDRPDLGPAPPARRGRGARRPAAVDHEARGRHSGEPPALGRPGPHVDPLPRKHPSVPQRPALQAGRAVPGGRGDPPVRGDQRRADVERHEPLPARDLLAGRPGRTAPGLCSTRASTAVALPPVRGRTPVYTRIAEAFV